MSTIKEKINGQEIQVTQIQKGVVRCSVTVNGVKYSEEGNFNEFPLNLQVLSLQKDRLVKNEYYRSEDGGLRSQDVGNPNATSQWGVFVSTHPEGSDLVTSPKNLVLKYKVLRSEEESTRAFLSGLVQKANPSDFTEDDVMEWEDAIKGVVISIEKGKRWREIRDHRVQQDTTKRNDAVKECAMRIKRKASQKRVDEEPRKEGFFARQKRLAESTTSTVNTKNSTDGFNNNPFAALLAKK